MAVIQPDPYYGTRIVYGDCEGPRGLCVAALVAGTTRPTTEQVSDGGFTVVTTNVKDIANRGGGNYSLVGYCSIDDLAGFRLDPPRGKTARAALALFRKPTSTKASISKHWNTSSRTSSNTQFDA